MLIDHVGDVWSGSIPNSFFLRLVGRIAFPIYAYLIAEGCRRTKDMKKYLIRLGVFALISEIPFDLCFENSGVRSLQDLTFLSFDYQNIFFSLFLSVLAIYIYETAKDTKFMLPGLLAFPLAMFAADKLNADYGHTAVFIICALYFLHNKIAQSAVMVIGSAMLYLPNMGYRGYLFGYNISFGFAAFIFASVPAVLIWFYNGERGLKLKYFFYIMYPLHLLVLAAVQIILIM